MNKFGADYIAIMENYANNTPGQIRKLTIIWICVANTVVNQYKIQNARVTN